MVSPERISISELCRRFSVDMAHGRHVGTLSAELFRITQPIHTLLDRYEDIAYTAGLLHNVALAGGHQKHHTRGRDIIREHPLNDLPDEDRSLIAVTTAFHRKRWKASRLEKEPSFQALRQDLRPTALTLSALVRIADGLDYSQSQTTQIVDYEVSEDEVIIYITGPYLRYDGDRAEEKSDLWHTIFDTVFEVNIQNA